MSATSSDDFGFRDDPRFALYEAWVKKDKEAGIAHDEILHWLLHASFHLKKVAESPDAEKSDKKAKDAAGLIGTLSQKIHTVLTLASSVQLSVVDHWGLINAKIAGPERIAQALHDKGYSCGIFVPWPVSELRSWGGAKPTSLDDLLTLISSHRSPLDGKALRELTTILSELVKVARAAGASFNVVRTAGPQLKPQLDRALVEIGATQERLPVSSGDPPYDGRGVVVGAVDFGCDFVHPNLRRSGGGSRVRLLWDQNGPISDFGLPLGRTFERDKIDEALRYPQEQRPSYVAPDDLPYYRLGYHPHDNYYQDKIEGGAHGTFVIDIAAGNGRATRSETVFRPGVAPEAEIAFVQVRKPVLLDKRPIFDGVAVALGALKIFQWADEYGSPVVVNISVNGTDGPHDGYSPFDDILDRLSSQPGRAIVVGAGNFYETRGHARGRVADGAPVGLTWRFAATDTHNSQIEIWYEMAPGRVPQALKVRLSLPSPTTGEELLDQTYAVAPGEEKEVKRDGKVVGHIINCADDPAAVDGSPELRRQILLSIKPHEKGKAAVEEDWKIQLEIASDAPGVQINFDAWMSRDDKANTHFAEGCAEPQQTLGTLACFSKAIVVGAYALVDGKRDVCAFSSSGPTRDHRLVPHIAAPGRGVWAARSTGFRIRYPGEGTPWRTSAAFVMDGTSTAAPFVTGTVALMLQKNPDLTVEQIREALIETARPYPSGAEGAPKWHHQVGAGLLLASAALDAIEEPPKIDNPLPAANEFP